MENRIKFLENELKRLKDAYYNNTPIVSDQEYDKLENELRNLSPDSPILNSVGIVPNQSDKVKHQIWMPSIQKFTKRGDVTDWFLDRECVFSYKLDGSSLCLVYEKDELTMMATRGNGYLGENKINFKDYIQYIPKTLDTGLNGYFTVWGEVVIRKNKFNLLQDEMIKRGLEPVKSIRNAVAGILNRKDNLDLAIYFDFVAHNIFGSNLLMTHLTKLSQLQDVGFITPTFQSNIDTSFDDFCYQYQNDSEYPYLTDGIVITEETVGYDLSDKTGHHYRWNCCYKFESETAITEVIDIQWQVGRTGKVTPVLVVKPTELSGCVVGKVTGHNYKTIVENGLEIGSMIEITRANEVIPKFLKVVSLPKSMIEEPITNCPECGNELILSETKTDLVCINENCPAIVIGKILHFCKTLGVDGVNDSISEKFFRNLEISNPINLIRLSKAELYKIEGFKEKMVDKIYNNIQMVLYNPNISKAVLVESLSIKNIGETVSVLLQDNGILDYEDFYENEVIVMNDIYDKLLKIEGIGETIRETVITNIKFIYDKLKEFQSVGFTYPFVKHEKTIIEDKTLSGLSFILSGSFTKSKKDIEKEIIYLGGTIAKSVCASLDILITNETDTTKCIKSKQMNKKIMTEEEFYNWIKI